MIEVDFETMDKNQTVDHHLYCKQLIKFRTFAINFVLILICWLLSMSDGFMAWTAGIMNVPVEIANIQMVGWIAIWKILNVVFFLAPALGVWWERKSLQKRMG